MEARLRQIAAKGPSAYEVVLRSVPPLLDPEATLPAVFVLQKLTVSLPAAPGSGVPAPRDGPVRFEAGRGTGPR